MIDSCTMMRIDPGVWLRTRLTAKLASAVTSVTPMPITSALSMRVVTASAEQMPSTCTAIGLLSMIGVEQRLALGLAEPCPGLRPCPFAQALQPAAVAVVRQPELHQPRHRVAGDGGAGQAVDAVRVAARRARRCP